MADRAEGRRRGCPGTAWACSSSATTSSSTWSHIAPRSSPGVADRAARPRAGRLRARAADARRPAGVHGDARGRTRSRANLHSSDVVRNEPLREPWCAHIARRARGIIVHSEFGRRYLEELGCRTPVFVVPHPVVESDADMRRAGDRGRELRAPTRGAWHALAGRRARRPERGEAAGRGARGRARARRRACTSRSSAGGSRATTSTAWSPTAGSGDRVTLAPDVSDDDFRGWLARPTSSVDLRFPHRGEVSGSLIRAMQAGKPSIVSATGTYLDVPDESWSAVGARADEPGGAGRPRSRRSWTTPTCGPGWARPPARTSTGLRAPRRPRRATRHAIEATLRLVRDPAHKAMAIWGKALADMGVDEADLARGLGVELRAGARGIPRNAIEPPKSRGSVARLDRTALTSASTRGAPTSPPHERHRTHVRGAPLRPLARIRELVAYREILLNLVRKELKVKYTASVLGAVWSLLNPSSSWRCSRSWSR